MFHSMTGNTVPPPPPPPPDGAAGAAGAEPPEAEPTVKSSMFIPPVSKYSVSCWVPAPRVTDVWTTVQFCQQPVPGTPTVFQTLLPELNPMWKDAPAGAATRSQTTYAPAAGTFTV